MKANGVVRTFQTVIAAVFLAALASTTQAADTYFRIPISALTITEGSWPSESDPTIRHWRSLPLFQAYATVDGEGEVYLDGDPTHRWTRSNGHALAIRAPKGKDVTGQLYVPRSDLSGMVALKFKVSGAMTMTCSEEDFLAVKQRHYRELRQRNVPGAAWFRRQEREAAKARRQQPDEGLTFTSTRRGPFEIADTYELFSGGRAISENLQLDRDLRMRSGNESTTEITNLTGINVREMDWKPLIKDAKPKVDTLAAYVPFDQHVIFFPSFTAMTKVFDEADAGGTPLLQWLEPRSEDAQTRTRYHKQLCLEVDEMSRVLGPQVITSVAITGSDPYLRTGSDVGILFEAKSPALLKAAFVVRQTAARQNNPGVKPVDGEIEGVPYTGVVSEDRVISSYLAAVNDVVIVSNSRFQLAELVKAALGNKKSIASQDEYIFFRQRYAKSDKDESALLVLTDATIRRWCGPQWRIANSRRTRAAAAMAQAQAVHLGSLVNGTAKPGKVASEASLPGDELQLTSSGVVSRTYGTLDFLTPIAELPCAKVTKAEADAYVLWRDGYQRNWRQFFDPIAVRVSISGRQIGAEVTVMPLIANTDYAQFIALTHGGQIAAGAGDPHKDTLLHLAMALNPQSEMVKSAGNWLGTAHSTLRVNPLGWLGSSISIYADKDAFWDELGKAQETSEYFRKNYHQLPLALHCEVKNPLGLAAFLSAIRAYSDQSAPGMTVWQTVEHNGKPYVKITGSQAMQQQGEFAKLAIYYAATPQSLILTLNESLLKRALDRQSARETGNAAGENQWLGTNLCLKVDQQFLSTLERSAAEGQTASQQVLSWNNLPILNEWKRLFPNEDPVKLHERFWQTKLVCPGGGAYVWNEKWHTMESTVYGHPGEPKKGPDRIGPLARFQSANLGLSFENQGLSAKVVLEQEVKATSIEQKKVASATRLWRRITGRAL